MMFLSEILAQTQETGDELELHHVDDDRTWGHIYFLINDYNPLQSSCYIMRKYRINDIGRIECKTKGRERRKKRAESTGFNPKGELQSEAPGSDS